MRIPESTIKDLHSCYCRVSGMEVPLTMQRMFTWEAWALPGHTIDDLRLVVEVLRRKIREGKNTLACLRFTNLIGDCERFQETLSEARAMSRAPKVDSGRADVLKATGRSATPEQSEARSVGDVLKAEAAFKEFQKLKDLL